MKCEVPKILDVGGRGTSGRDIGEQLRVNYGLLTTFFSKKLLLECFASQMSCLRKLTTHTYFYPCIY